MDLFVMTTKIAALKRQAEAPPTGPGQAATLKARREKTPKELRRTLGMTPGAVLRCQGLQERGPGRLPQWGPGQSAETLDVVSEYLQ